MIKFNKTLLLLMLLSSVFFTVNTYAGFNDTGITTCSNATQDGLTCPVTDFPGQDAEFGTNSFDFTKLDANGAVMPVTATNHVCVQDNVTGLMWEVKTDDGGLRDKDNLYSFDEAATFATNVNATNLCGHDDWRVPNPYELASIVDYSVYPGPTIDGNFFPNTASAYFWTNTTYAADSKTSWVVGFSHGYVDYISTIDTPVVNYDNAVRLVRVGQMDSSFSFVDQGDGTVTETNTGLMWAKCSVGQVATDCSGSAGNLTWQQALQAADSSTLADFTDWRLPNVKELQTLVDYTKVEPSINISVFPSTPSASYCSSSPVVATDSMLPAWLVEFNDGSILNAVAVNDSCTVRLVRSGQVTLPFSLNVTKQGTGNGTVTSSPPGIDCGTDCNESYTSNTSVTLTATPATDSTFDGWSGDCTGTAAPPGTAATCTLTVDATKNVTATFSTNAPNPSVPTAVTNAPTVVTGNSVRMSGTINDNGADTTVTFEFGTSSSYGETINAEPNTIQAGSGNTNVAATKEGLICNTTYYYRVTAVNSAGTISGEAQSFTPSCTILPPAVETKAPTNVNSDSATLNGTVNDNGADTTVTFEFGTTTDYGTSITATPSTITAGSGSTNVAANKGDLTCGIAYHYRVKTVNSGSNVTVIVYGNNQSFTIPCLPDFAITAEFSPPLLISKMPFRVNITVKNLGKISGDAGYLDVWLDNPTDLNCGTTEIGEYRELIGELAAGEQRIVPFDNLKYTTHGIKKFRAFVNSNNCQTEAKQDNNKVIK